MKRFSPVLALFAATTVVLTLSSCAPAVNSTVPTTHPHATTKPHPAKAQPAVPALRVPVKCASLLTDAAAAAMIGSPIKHHVDETTQPVDVTEIAQRQDGSLACLWGGDPQDGGYDQFVSIDITPDAAAGFAANIPSFSNQDPPDTVNTVGDRSAYGCTTDGELHCTGNALVGSFWVTAYVQNLGALPVSAVTASANIKQILQTAAAAVKSATPGSAWNPPGPALPQFCSAASSTAQVNAALGGTDFTTAGEDNEEEDAASYTQLPNVYTQCTWQSGSSAGPFTFLSVAMLRGGAWVMPKLPGAINSRAYMLNAYTSMTVPGATAAAGSCSVDADECLVALSIGSLLVVVNLDDPSDAQSSAALAKIVTAIKAS
jgi:hypothetical protein